MNTFSDEIILYIGLIIAAVSVLSGIAFFVIHTINKRKLNAKFDTEYGEVQKKK